MLDNLKILGDDIDIRGGIALDAHQRLKEFYFSDFSVNSLTHLEISATVRDDQVLDIKAEGQSYRWPPVLPVAVLRRPDGRRGGTGRPVRRRPDRADQHGHGLLRHRRQGRGGHHEEARRPARRARRQGRAQRQIAGRGPSRAGRERRATDQRRSPQRGRCVPPGGLLSERRGRRGVVSGQSRCRRPGGQERDAVGARFRRAGRFRGERRAHRSELGRRAGRSETAGHPSAHRVQSAACAVHRRRRQVPSQGRLHERADARRHLARVRSTSRRRRSSWAAPMCRCTA